MKIKVIHLISSLKIGGAESWLVDLLQNLQHDYEHHIIFFHDGPNRAELEKLGFKTYHCKPPFYNPFFAFKLYTTIKRINPPLIHSSLWAANLYGRCLAKLMSIPLISTIHLGIDEDGPIRNLFDRFTFSWTNHAIAVSTVVEKSMDEKKAWLKSAPYSTIKNGITIPAIKKPITKADVTIPHDAFVFGSVGRFIPRKNYDWFLDCFAAIHQENPQTHFLLLGLGDEEGNLRRKVADLKLTKAVTFVIGKKALPYFSAMDCFVQPSTQEGLSIALLEAMAHKLPCIATSPDNQHDALVSYENGIVVPLEKNAMISACAKLINDKALHERLSKQAFASVQDNYSCTAMAQEYEKLYKKYSK